jgi:hypothetical protein
VRSPYGALGSFNREAEAVRLTNPTRVAGHADPSNDNALQTGSMPWFEGTTQIDCDLESVKTSVADFGTHFAGVVSSMPGITEAELLEQGEDFVTIGTNEGEMRRNNIECSVGDDEVVLRFDEVYETSKVTGRSHFEDTYTASSSGGVQFKSVVSDVQADGVLGFLYRKFGSRNMGKAFLPSQKKYFESTQR